MANSEPSSIPPPPEFNFTLDDSVKPWDLSSQDWMTANDKHWDGIACSVIVFDSQDRILLLQRAAHDSKGHYWETPGGAVDREDPTILHGCARELWEEARQVAVRFTGVLSEGEGKAPGGVFTSWRRNLVFCNFSFVAEVEQGREVVLDPNEHQDWLWASEEEVKTGSVGDKKIPITGNMMKNLLTEAWRLRRERRNAGQ